MGQPGNLPLVMLSDKAKWAKQMDRLHDRPAPSWSSAVSGEGKCVKCGHVGCKGECR